MPGHSGLLATPLNKEVEAEIMLGKDLNLIDSQKFVGYIGQKFDPREIILKNNGLHIRVQIDKSHSIGRKDKAKIKDIIIESALTVIMDCEDSVSAVDGQDKTLAYRNWFGLMSRKLTADINKNGIVILFHKIVINCFILLT